jgi:hypothetical protein
LFKEKKKKKLLGRVLKIGAGAAAVGGLAYGTNRLIKNTPKKQSSGSATPPKKNIPLDKKARNSQLVKQRLDALGGTAAGLKNKTGRTAAEIANLRNMKKVLGRKNAAKARKLRSQGKYFKRKDNLVKFVATIKKKRRSISIIGGGLLGNKLYGDQKKRRKRRKRY